MRFNKKRFVFFLIGLLLLAGIIIPFHPISAEYDGLVVEKNVKTAFDEDWQEYIEVDISKVTSVNFQITIRNYDRGPIISFEIIDILPDGLIYIPNSCDLGEPEISDNQLGWFIDNFIIYPGEYIDFHFWAEIIGCGIQTNWVDVNAKFEMDVIRSNYDFAVVNVLCPNSPPDITSFTGPSDPIEINNIALFDATFIDPDIDDYHTAFIDWGDESNSIIYLPLGDRSLSFSHQYMETGVYEVLLRITDSFDNFDEAVFESYIVVYDPDGGFVTGGGWIDSPAGSFVADPDLVGTANFGFVAKYTKAKDVPIGNTEFHFQAGDLNFHSSGYDWLLVTGFKAMYKGFGTINGMGNFGFMVFAVDARLHPTYEVDMFRIKIWDMENGDAVVYDNNVVDENGDPATMLSGGQIVVHVK